MCRSLGSVPHHVHDEQCTALLVGTMVGLKPGFCERSGSACEVPHTVTPTIVTGKTELGFRRWDGIGQDMVCTTRFVLWVLMTSTQAGACRRRLHSRM